MADHLDSPGLMPPGGDASIDITDIYAFLKPGDATKSILILNVNPLTLAPGYNTSAIYEVKVDTDGDALADVAFKVRFTSVPGGGQTAEVRLATGAQARGGTSSARSSSQARLCPSAPRRPSRRTATSNSSQGAGATRSSLIFSVS